MCKLMTKSQISVMADAYFVEVAEIYYKIENICINREERVAYFWDLRYCLLLPVLCEDQYTLLKFSSNTLSESRYIYDAAMAVLLVI